MSTTEGTTVGQIVKRQNATLRIVKVENGVVYAEKLNPKTMVPYKTGLRKWSL